MKLSFILNGKAIQQDILPADPLLTVLRRAGCASVRCGCDTANCGICTVWVDDTPILSCSYPAARAEGKHVTTLEGVRPEAEEIMTLMAEEGADQCGFCSPGFIMSVLAMLRELDDPSEAEIARYLSGNLCRCTGYASQTRMLKKLYEKRRNANG